jgi:CxxC motif-containing protein
LKEIICIVCPKGCHLQVDENNGYKVTGNKCTRGIVYGEKEVTNPTRVLTSIVPIEGGMYSCCTVKTSEDIPKEKIMEVMELLKNIKIKSPVNIGDIVISNICGTKSNWVVTKNM